VARETRLTDRNGSRPRLAVSATRSTPGWCLGCLGFEVSTGSRLGLGLVGTVTVFYDLRSREEDRLLAARYPGASHDRAAVKRFVPGVC
jgi:hypothetical protein